MEKYSQEEMAEMLRKKQERVERLRLRRLERMNARKERGRSPRPGGDKTPDKAPISSPVSPKKPVVTSDPTKDILTDIKKLIPEKSKQRKVVLAIAKPEFNHNVQPAPRVIKYDKGIQISLETELEKSLQADVARLRKRLSEASQSVGVGDGDVNTPKPDEVKTIEQQREHERAFMASLLPLPERKRIMRTDKFLNFFKKSCTVIERALTQNDDFDITINYSKKEEKADQKEEAWIKPGPTFTDGLRTNMRTVTSIAWSPKHKDLFLASYAEQQNIMSMDPDGLVLVWSTHTPSRPEYTLTCQSAVLVAQFHPVKPNIVIAGTKSGQVIVWDLSVKSTPVNRTSLSQGHTHPVYAMSSVPAVNKAYSILSVSTDGHVCIWQDTDHLEEPSMELDLTFVGRKNDVKDRDITTTCFGFVGRDFNSLILGSDEGVLYNARIYDGPNAAPGIHSYVSAHVAPISNVCFRPPIKGLPTLMSELYLTCSFDWTTKLWHTKTKKPLCTFERCRDYVYDIQWSPMHPAIFATGDGNGKLDIWNLNKDFELPTQTIQATEKDRTISKIAFSGDGQSIAVGTSSGSVKMFSLREELANPAEEDAKQFYESIQARIQQASQRQNDQMGLEKMGRRYASNNNPYLGSITSVLNARADR